MNFSEERDSRDSTTPSLGKWISTSSSSTVTQSFEVAVEPVGLLDQHDAHGGMPLQIGDHLAKRGPAALLGGLHVHIFLRHHEPVGGRVFLEELQLRRD